MRIQGEERMKKSIFLARWRMIGMAARVAPSGRGKGRGITIIAEGAKFLAPSLAFSTYKVNAHLVLLFMNPVTY